MAMIGLQDRLSINREPKRGVVVRPAWAAVSSALISAARFNQMTVDGATEGLGAQVPKEMYAVRLQRPLACCRFHGHRVKVLEMEPEFSHGVKKVQPRVQA